MPKIGYTVMKYDYYGVLLGLFESQHHPIIFLYNIYLSQSAKNRILGHVNLGFESNAFRVDLSITQQFFP